MPSSLETLRSKLNSEIRIDPNDKIWSSSEKEDFLNDAYFQLQDDGNFDWPENQAPVHTLTTTAGIIEYNLPTDFQLLTFIKSGTNNELLPITFEAVQRLAGSNNSKASHYYIRASKIGFWPTPSGSETISIVYRNRLNDMGSGQDCEFPTTFDRAIVKYAAYLLWSGPRGNEGKAQQKLLEYKMEKNKLFGAYLLRDTATLNFSQQRGLGRQQYFPDRLL